MLHWRNGNCSWSRHRSPCVAEQTALGQRKHKLLSGEVSSLYTLYLWSVLVDSSPDRVKYGEILSSLPSGMFFGIRLGYLSDVRFQGHAFIAVMDAFVIAAQSVI